MSMFYLLSLKEQPEHHTRFLPAAAAIPTFRSCPTVTCGSRPEPFPVTMNRSPVTTTTHSPRCRNDPLPGFPTPLVLQLFHLTPTCSSARAALCCFTAFPSTTSLRGNCRKKTSAKMFYSRPWPAQWMQIQALRARAQGRARPWLPAVRQYGGNNVHSSNAGLIHAVSCFSRSI